MSVRIIEGDVRETLAQIPDAAVRCCVTSPPYFGLRDYGHAGQIGLEKTPDAYVAELVAVFREVRRVLADDGTLWLNLGDSYAGSGKGGNPIGSPHKKQRTNAGSLTVVGATAREAANTRGPGDDRCFGAKPKDLLGIPWRVAFALQADGWYLRSDIIWHKPNPMPESVTDRPTKAHEYVFLLTKSARYFYDAGAIAEEATGRDPGNVTPNKHAGEAFADTKRNLSLIGPSETRNARTVWPVQSTGNRERECLAIIASGLSVQDKWDAVKAMLSGAQTEVWRIATQPYKGAHFATMPPALAERCVRAGSAPGDTVLDPFGGAGTTGLVADRLGRDAILCELNPTYAALARERINGDNPLFTEVT